MKNIDIEMRTARVLFSCLLYSALLCAASASPKASALSGCGAHDGDHLVPIVFESDLNYRTVLVNKLFLSTSEYGRALIMPSSDGESSVAVYSSKNGAMKEEAHVSYTQAERNIRNAQSRENSSRDDIEQMKVKQIDVAIPRETAFAVAAAWSKMLCRTALYPVTADDRPIIHATTVEFSLVKLETTVLYGQIDQGHKTQHVEALYKIAELLISYCKAQPDSRPALASEIKIAADGLANLPD